jgi:hypothetical protein
VFDACDRAGLQALGQKMQAIVKANGSGANLSIQGYGRSQVEAGGQGKLVKTAETVIADVAELLSKAATPAAEAKDVGRLSVADELAKLVALRADDVLSESEFQEKRRRLLE